MLYLTPLSSSIEFLNIEVLKDMHVDQIEMIQNSNMSIQPC
jgi:hypothetical protein